MFKKLAGLLANNAAVTLLLTGNANAMTVTVIPKAAKAVAGQEALSTPLVLSGTADELDAGFADLVVNFTEARKSLAEQFEATAAVLEAAKKESASNAAKGLSKAAKAGATSSSSAPIPGDGEEDDEMHGDGGNSSSTPAANPATVASTNLFG